MEFELPQPCARVSLHWSAEDWARTLGPDSASNTMASDAQTTVRNAGGILVQRALHAGSGLVFAILVPRFMGPDIYGRYSLLTSLSIWFLLFSSFNLTDVIGRYVPELVLRSDRSRLQALWSDLLTLRLTTGVDSCVAA
jgi:O-antigen/teichoic acid export membrane protein